MRNILGLLVMLMVFALFSGCAFFYVVSEEEQVDVCCDGLILVDGVPRVLSSDFDVGMKDAIKEFFGRAEAIRLMQAPEVVSEYRDGENYFYVSRIDDGITISMRVISEFGSPNVIHKFTLRGNVLSFYRSYYDGSFKVGLENLGDGSYCVKRSLNGIIYGDGDQWNILSSEEILKYFEEEYSMWFEVLSNKN